MSKELFWKKEEWGDGPWLNEPGMNEKIEFEYKGYPCTLTRNWSGSWCGYVAIARYHPDINPDNLDVHGGITWEADHLPWEEFDSKSDLCWIGFDCSHSNDLSPRHEKILYASSELCATDEKLKEFRKIHGEHSRIFERSYRTLEFAKYELNRLVDQLVEIGEDNVGPVVP